jgi:sulfur carrier protein
MSTSAEQRDDRTNVENDPSVDTRDIEIQVNGQPHLVPEGVSVVGLLEKLTVDRRTVVVELNRQILRRTELEEIRLEPGDRVELVQFVGGG